MTESQKQVPTLSRRQRYRYRRRSPVSSRVDPTRALFASPHFALHLKRPPPSPRSTLSTAPYLDSRFSISDFQPSASSMSSRLLSSPVNLSRVYKLLLRSSSTLPASRQRPIPVPVPVSACSSQQSRGGEREREPSCHRPSYARTLACDWQSSPVDSNEAKLIIRSLPSRTTRGLPDSLKRVTPGSFRPSL
jgi:hypothetical protein